MVTGSSRTIKDNKGGGRPISDYWSPSWLSTAFMACPGIQNRFLNKQRIKCLESVLALFSKKIYIEHDCLLTSVAGGTHYFICTHSVLSQNGNICTPSSMSGNQFPFETFFSFTSSTAVFNDFRCLKQMIFF